MYRAADGKQDDDDDETYLRINYFFPTIDDVVSDIKLRFGPSLQKAVTLSYVIPTLLHRWRPEWVVDKAGKRDRHIFWLLCWSTMMMIAITIRAEYELWCRKWRVPKEERPKSAIAALHPTSSFPNIPVVLQTVATIPITTAEAERCISQLERIMTGIWASMGRNASLSLANLLWCYKSTDQIPQILMHLLTDLLLLQHVDLTYWCK